MKNVLELREAYNENLKKVSPIFSRQYFDKVNLLDFNDFGFAVTNELCLDGYEFAKGYMPEKYWDLFYDVDFVYELTSEKTWSYGALKFAEDVEMEEKYFSTGIEYLYKLGFESIWQIGDELLREKIDTASYKDFINEINEFNTAFREARYEFKNFVDENFYRIFKFEL